MAFDGAGEDLRPIIDSGNAFINAANENFDVTTALIRDSNTVLKGQIASSSAIRTLRPRPARCSADTLAGSDQDLRTVIDNGIGDRQPSCAPSSRTTRSSSAS